MNPIHTWRAASTRLVLRSALAGVALLGATLSGCAAPQPEDPFDPISAAEGLPLGEPAFEVARAWSGPGLPFPPEANPWSEIREERIRRLLPEAMERAGVDVWLLILRENHNDPLAHHVGGENAGGLAVFLFLREGSGQDGGAGLGAQLRSLAFSPGGEAQALRDVGLHDEVRVPAAGQNAITAAAAYLQELDPRVIAVNSANLAVADGLSHTQRMALESALGPLLTPRLVSSEELVTQWLSVKTDREVDIMAQAAEITEALELEAYARVIPGQTTDADVARFLKRRMAQLGVGDAWSPDQNPNVNSGADRGHSHSTDRVIQAGDVIQTDFGIRVWDMWVTDIQRFAYVLAPGETSPPDSVQFRWESARAGNRAAFQAMRPGARGVEVDAAQREVMRDAGSLEVYWNTGHPVGYWAHDVGPSLGGAQAGRTPSPHASRPLLPGHTFAFDGFFSWPYMVGGIDATKTISVEEMVVIAEEGARWLVAPQEELVLIPSR